jgi:hypothetical protein
MIVGGADLDVLDLNQQAIARMRAPVRLKIIPGASHLFEEPGALDRVALLAAQWFRDHAPAQAGAQVPALAGAYGGARRDAGMALAEPLERRQRAERRRWPRSAVSALTASLAAGLASPPAVVNGSLPRPPATGRAPGQKTFRPGR